MLKAARQGAFEMRVVLPEKEHAMIQLDLNTNIYRPLKQVFVFVTTSENDFYWQYGTLMSAKISDGETGVGTLFRAVGHFMGQRMENVYEVTEFELDKRYGFKSISGPLELSTSYTFDIMKGSTRICHSTQINLGNLSRSNPVSVEKTVKKEYRENFALLKNILEATQVDKTAEPALPVSTHRR